MHSRPDSPPLRVRLTSRKSFGSGQPEGPSISMIRGLAFDASERFVYVGGDSCHSIVVLDATRPEAGALGTP